MNNPTNVKAILQSLTANEHRALITIFRLIQEWKYQRVTDLDLYTSANMEFEDAHAALNALHTRQLIEMEADYTVTSLTITRDLSDAEKHVLGTIVDFMHAFQKEVNFRNLVINAGEEWEAELPTLLAQLAQRGLVTLAEDYTVNDTFKGTSPSCHSN